MTGPDPTDPFPSNPPPASPPPSSPPPGPSTGSTASGAPAWTNQLMSREATPGPAGLYYADVPNRIIALIIDAILLAIAGVIVGILLTAIFGATVRSVPDATQPFGFRLETNFLSTLVSTLVGLALSAGYYIYMWTRMRGTIGQRALGMQVGNASDGATLTTEQAVKRWLALGGALSLAQFLNPIPGVGLLIGLLSLVWVIALLVTTAQSPTKQGLHDQFANSIVVKAGRSVG